tara:strand:+ start:39 stop:458 length:420 start_codon:yes stop_codon:yes gene_type:complete
MTTATKPNHALINCKGQLENIIELYKLSQQEADWNDDRDIEEEARDEALDVCWKSDDWQAVGDQTNFTPTKGRVLLSTGGPACQVVCDLEDGYPVNPEIQWQDWGTPWTAPSIQCELELDFDTATAALEWFIDLFWWGE